LRFDEKIELVPTNWRLCSKGEKIVVWPMDEVNCWPIVDEAKIWLNVVEAEIGPNEWLSRNLPNEEVVVAKRWAQEAQVSTGSSVWHRGAKEGTGSPMEKSPNSLPTCTPLKLRHRPNAQIIKGNKFLCTVEIDEHK
jgi:hypothetical protein